VRDRESIRFATPIEIPGGFGVLWGEVGNRVLRSRAGLVGVRILCEVHAVEPMSGSVTVLRIGLGGDD
jgi:hypothetical protein